MENNSNERRWVTSITGLAEYLGCPEGVAWGLREKGCPAIKSGTLKRS
jgi:hypothetical protein